jgi:A/G-specific adenine glycosylase
VAVIAMNADGAVLLERRPPTGIWGGLWTFPQFEDRDAAAHWIDGAGHTMAEHRQLPDYRHTFTHFDLTLQPLLIRVPVNAAVAEEGTRLWYDPRQPARVGLAKPAVDLIAMLSVE